MFLYVLSILVANICKLQVWIVRDLSCSSSFLKYDSVSPHKDSVSPYTQAPLIQVIIFFIIRFLNTQLKRQWQICELKKLDSLVSLFSDKFICSITLDSALTLRIVLLIILCIFSLKFRFLSI